MDEFQSTALCCGAVAAMTLVLLLLEKWGEYKHFKAQQRRNEYWKRLDRIGIDTEGVKHKKGDRK